MPMKNPSHPGEILRELCLDELGVTVTAAAAHMGVSRQALNNVVNGKARVSPEMALRIARAFGSTPEFWLRVQMNHDVAQLGKIAPRIQVTRYPAKKKAAARKTAASKAGRRKARA